MNTDTLQAALAELFAPWVQALGLRVQSCEAGVVTLRLPRNDQLSRVGDMLCGQAMMAAADTAMVLALISHFGAFPALHHGADEHELPQAAVGPGRDHRGPPAARRQGAGFWRNRHPRRR
jgi:hypothetical protein